jgi:hypothetical protein
MFRGSSFFHSYADHSMDSAAAKSLNGGCAITYQTNLAQIL